MAPLYRKNIQIYNETKYISIVTPGPNKYEIHHYE